MSNKTPKARSPSNQRPEISEPLTFNHVVHYEKVRQSPEGHRSPLPCRARNVSAGQFTQNFEFSTELIEPIRRLIQAELEPIKAKLDELIHRQRGVYSDDVCPDDLFATSQQSRRDEVSYDLGLNNSVDESPLNADANNDSVFYNDMTEDQIYVNIESIRRNNEQCTIKTRSLSNPTYSTCDVTSSVKDHEEQKHDDKIVDETPPASGLRVRKPCPSPRPRKAVRPPSSPPPNESLTRPVGRLQRRRVYSNVNERECLARALQCNIEGMVNDLIFDESELPDQLEAESCVTTDECNIIRKRTRKDQVRLLISIIKGRDLSVLKKFLKFVERSNKDLADKIYTNFEENKKLLPSGKYKCPCCDLKATVDIKYVADGLYGIFAISDGLYREIVDSDKHAGSQDELWNRLIYSSNNLETKEKRKEACAILIKNLAEKKYVYIANKIERAVANDKHITCDCEICFRNVSQKTNASSSCSPSSSIHDRD